MREKTFWAVLFVESLFLVRLTHPLTLEADLSSFDTIDTNDDGKISRKELSKTSPGLPACVNDLIARSFNDSSVDVDEDGLLSEIEWYNFLASRLGRLITVGEVADWIAFAVQKPQYANLFREHFVSGHDFIDLVRNGGLLLSEELGISNTAARNHIRRQMIMKLCTDAQPPEVPSNLTLTPAGSGVIVSWTLPESLGAPVVSFQLQRADHHSLFRNIPEPSTSVNSLHTEPTFHDSLHRPGIYQYRVQAWSILGRSGWSTPVQHQHSIRSLPHTATSSTFGSTLSSINHRWLDWLLICITASCMVYGYTQLAQPLWRKNNGDEIAASDKPHDNEFDSETVTRAVQKELVHPKAPRNVRAIGGDQEVCVEWEYDLDALSTVVEFTITCRQGTSEDRTYRAPPGSTMTSIRGLENGLTYTACVVAVGINGTLGMGKPVSVVPLPDQRKNSADRCNWCRSKLGLRRHTCRNCDASFCGAHGHIQQCLNPLTPCINCLCKFCIVSKDAATTPLPARVVQY